MSDGRPALFKAGSHELVPVDNCLVTVPSIQRMLADIGSIDAVHQLTLRAGVNTGETVALADDDFGRIHEVVSGKQFRISGRAFFQNNTGGAEVLVKLVKEATDPREGDILVDAYAGGGLFSATVGEGCRVYAVESDPQAVSDLVVNAKATVLAERFESCASLPTSWDLAVADPPRVGLGRRGVDRLLAGRARAIAYVSCDPASFARDAALLVAGGYRLDWVQPVDMFPQTFHVEMVGRFLFVG
jgi:tRNA/tmRNA/rRNA uracil-C5-methylase (TrmA/RlmC/RlmD family)